MNGVNPDDVIRDYGADVMRLYEMFMGEFELPKPWDPRAIEGVQPLPEARLAPGRGVRRGARRPPTIRTCACATRPSSGSPSISSACSSTPPSRRMMEYLNVLAEGGVNRATREDL